MVLDDVLIGLDNANRIPVLNLIAEEFADWQVVLLTHDKTWYEFARLGMDSSVWKSYELFVGPNGAPVHHPRDKAGPDFYLGKAREHLENNDVSAAGNYARQALESKLKKHCDDKAILVRYRMDPAKVQAQDLWDAAKKRALPESLPAAQRQELEKLFLQLEAFRSVVLNPLSHASPIHVTRAEIEGAIQAIQDLRFS